MIEPASASAALLAVTQLTTFVHEHDDVPSEIRSCLALVRACQSDLKCLIEACNEHQALLVARPADQQRVDAVIEAAIRNLHAAAYLVEKRRLSSRSSRTGLFKRLAWTHWDKESFRKSQPLIDSHHKAVLQALTHVQSLGLSHRQVATGKRGTDSRRGDPAFKTSEGSAGMSEEIGLLNEMLSGLNMSPRNTHVAFNLTHASSPNTSIHASAIRATTTNSHRPSQDAATTRKWHGNSGTSRPKGAPKPKSNSSIEDDGLALEMWDLAAPVVQNNTSINIQKTVVNAPINLVINVNGGASGAMTKQMTNDIQTSVEAGFLAALGQDAGSARGGNNNSVLRHRRQPSSLGLPSHCAELDGIPVNKELHMSIHEMPGELRRM